MSLVFTAAMKNKLTSKIKIFNFLLGQWDVQVEILLMEYSCTAVREKIWWLLHVHGHDVCCLSVCGTLV